MFRDFGAETLQGVESAALLRRLIIDQLAGAVLAECRRGAAAVAHGCQPRRAHRRRLRCRPGTGAGRVGGAG